MQKKMNKEKVSLISNEAVQGKPWLDIDRVFNVKETKRSVENKEKI